jgi:hypothetical protein
VILAGHVVRVVAKRGASMILVWENWRKEMTWKILTSWEDNIKMDLIEIAGGRRSVWTGSVPIFLLLSFLKRSNWAYKITTLLSSCLSVSPPASDLRLFDRILIAYERNASGD